MTRALVSNAIAALLALPLFAAAAAAEPEDQAVFTNFENITPNTSPGDVIVVGVSPDSADLAGDAFGGAIGVVALYHSCCKAWMRAGKTGPFVMSLRPLTRWAAK